MFWGSVFALLLYQPHFVATYFLNYRKGRNFLFRYRFTHLVLPLLLILLILLTAVNEMVFHDQRLIQFQPYFLFMVILFGLFHFSAQAAGAVTRLSENSFSRNETGILRFLFYLTAIYGLINHLKYQNHQYRLFLLQITFPVIPDSALLVFGILLILFHSCFIVKSFQKLNLLSLMPWFSLLIWFMIPVFQTTYFFLIPIFHAIQFIPFYLIELPQKKNYLLSLALILISFLMIYALPNILQDLMVENFSIRSSTLFAMILLCINLHHFALERVTWKN